MLAEDIKPNRLSIVKLELTNIISKLTQNRIGIIALAEYSLIKCSLTLDIYNKNFFNFIKYKLSSYSRDKYIKRN